MGLRLPHEGIDLDRVDAATRLRMEQTLPMLQQEGFVQRSNTCVHITPKGVPVLNAVIGSLLSS